VDIKANSDKQDIMANLVKLELTGGTLLSRQEDSKLDIQVNQLAIPVIQQVTLVNQLVILINLLHILHIQEDILLQQVKATLVLGACRTQHSRHKGCRVYFTHRVLMDLQLA